MLHKTVLITRSQQENLLLKAKLNESGFKVIEWNLINYIDLAWDNIPANFTDIIITSKHAARMMAERVKILEPIQKYSEDVIAGELGSPGDPKMLTDSKNLDCSGLSRKPEGLLTDQAIISPRSHPEFISGSKINQHNLTKEILKQVQDDHLGMQDDHLGMQDGTGGVIPDLYTTKFASVWNDKNFYVVGNQSAKILQLAGFNIKIIANNVQELIVKLPQNRYGQMIYLSGDKITKELPQEVRRRIIYNVIYKNTLDWREINDLRQGVNYILLYSANCVKTLINLLDKYDLVNSTLDTKIITISEKLANIIRLYFKNIIYCQDGNYDQIIELLNNDAGHGK